VLFGIFTLYIGLDAIIWNTLFIVVDTYFLIPLIKERLPIKLSKQEEEFFKTVEKYMTKFQFKMLIDNGEQRKYYVSGSQICKEGNPCDEVVLFFRIPANRKVTAYKDNKPVMNIEQGSYIGHVEFISKNTVSNTIKKAGLSSESHGKKVNWHISCQVENETIAAKEVNLDDEDDEVYEDSSDSEYDDPNSILCFKWDFKRMRMLFKDPTHGRTFENTMYSLWLKSISDSVLQQDKEIFDHKVKKHEFKRSLVNQSMRSHSMVSSPKDLSKINSSSISSSKKSSTSSSMSDDGTLSYRNAFNIQKHNFLREGK
jgi:hypothetical protein